MMSFFEVLKFSENDSMRGSCPSSYPSGNQVDGSPLVAMILKFQSSIHPGHFQKLKNEKKFFFDFLIISKMRK